MTDKHEVTHIQELAVLLQLFLQSLDLLPQVGGLGAVGLLLLDAAVHLLLQLGLQQLELPQHNLALLLRLHLHLHLLLHQLLRLLQQVWGTDSQWETSPRRGGRRGQELDEKRLLKHNKPGEEYSSICRSMMASPTVHQNIRAIKS